jgi:sulfur carrier protein
VNELSIVANGKARNTAEGATVADFLRGLDLEAARVIVEYNGEPLERERFAHTSLQAGDRIEIAQMVGGG